MEGVKGLRRFQFLYTNISKYYVGKSVHTHGLLAFVMWTEVLRWKYGKM